MINSNSTHIRRTALAALAALAALGAAGTTAAHANVTVEKTALGNYFVSAGYENNKLSVTGVGSKLLFTDENTPVDAQPGCNQITANTVSCPDLPEGGIYMFTGSGTDVVNSHVPESLYVDGTQTTKLTATAGIGAATLRGGDGNDVLNGGLGDDTIQGGKGNDVLNGSIGSDTLDGGEGIDTFKADAGADDYTGGPGVDTVDYGVRSAPLEITLDNVATDGQAGEGDNVRSDVENVVGGKGNDTIRGTDAANILRGGPGDDDITGYGGQDQLYGDADQDQLYGGNDADTLFGGEGMDRLDGGADPDTLHGDNGPDTLLGGTGNDKMYGDAGTDTVSYQSLVQPVTVDLDGSAFDDGPANEGDTVGADVENIIGSKSDDVLTGNGADNYIEGGPGKDTIDGGGGEDTLMGQEGDDTLLALDGLKDTANCGLGNDKVSADAIDVLVSCEDTGATTTGGGNTGGGNTGPGNTGPGNTGGGQTPATVLIGIAGKATVKKGTAKVKLACPASAKAACAGTLTLRTTKKKSVGSAKFRIAPGKKAQVTVKIKGAGVKALRSSRTLTTVATATAPVASKSTGKVRLTLAR